MEISIIFNPVFLNASKHFFLIFILISSHQKTKSMSFRTKIENTFLKNILASNCLEKNVFELLYLKLFLFLIYVNMIMYSFVKISCPQRWGHTGFFIFMFPFVFCLRNFNLVIITSEPCNTNDVPPVGVYIKTFCQEPTQTQTRMTKYFCIINVHRKI